MKSRGITRLLLPAALLVSLPLGAQERTVTGTVTQRETLQPFPGVEVAVKGTRRVAVTDAQGFYTLRLPADAEILVFSYLGYRSRRRPQRPGWTSRCSRRPSASRASRSPPSG